MTFFDANGNSIQPQEWLNTYVPFYFLGPNQWGGRPRNKTSRYVEDKVCALLRKNAPLSRDDLVSLMAWKIGLIDHRLSEQMRKIEYVPKDWPTTLTAGSQYGTLDFSKSLPYFAANMPTITTQIGRDPQYLFNLKREQPRKLEGFGYVYLITLQFFITGGRFPIYDKFAHVAALAIDQGLRPTSPPTIYVRHGLTNWSDYQAYMNLLARVKNACPLPAENSGIFISRDLDRALWVYGHFFKTEPGAIPQRKPTQQYRPALRTSGSTEFLVGRICDLCNAATDGWRRREINVRQGADGYPAVRGSIHLIDSSGAKYPGLTFVEGARLPGHTCLGQPGALKRWFTQHYQFEQVESSNVYFKPTGQLNEYQIYSEAEWGAAGAPGSRPSFAR